MSEKQPSLLQRYTDVSETLAGVSETVTRIDERVDIFINKIDKVETELKDHADNCPAKCSLVEIISRLSVIESKNGKILREELLGHITDQKQTLKSLGDKVDILDKNLTGVKTSTDAQAGRWKWIGLFLFNATFNIAALVAAAYFLHLWKVANQ